MKGHAKFPESLYHVQEILACVAFVEEFQNGIVYRLNRTDDEETASIAKSGEMLFVFAQVLDFNRYVVGELREFPVEFLNEFHGVADAVEEVRIAERDMLRAGSRLAANVFENNIAADDSKDTFVYRHDRTVPAKVFAAPAGLRRTHDAIAIARHDQMRIFFNGRQAGTVRYFERQPGKRDKRLGLPGRFLFSAGCQAFGQMHESFFKFAAKDRGDSERAKVFHIHGRVETVTTEMRARIQIAQRRNQLCSQPSGSVHRQIDCDQLGIVNGRFVQRLSREIQRNYVMTALPQPRRRRGQSERLPAELIGRNENDVHVRTSIAAGHLNSISVIIEGCVPSERTV